MTQLGEQIALGVTSSMDDECPFDHRHSKEQMVENKLIGSGGELAGCMAGGSSTVTYSRYRPDISKRTNPGRRFRGKSPICVEYFQTQDGKPRRFYYPVTCAAHHLIPAQASLRECKNLLKFMSSKHDGGDQLKKQSKFVGVVWNDIGYDVNGSENGVFLPGPYAVGGNGTGEWVGALSALDEEDEESSIDWSPPQQVGGRRMLSGRLHSIQARNMKWQYVESVSKLIGGQFHDAHPKYSRFVLGILNKIATRLNAERRKSIHEQLCNKCKQREDKISDLGVPPPYGLAIRLNGVSNRVKGMLTGGARHGHPQVFTSRWGLAWARANARK